MPTAAEWAAVIAATPASQPTPSPGTASWSAALASARSGGGGGGGGSSSGASAVVNPIYSDKVPSTLGLYEATTLQGIPGYYTASGFVATNTGQVIDPYVPESVLRNTPQRILAADIGYSNLVGIPLSASVDTAYKTDYALARAADQNLLLRASRILPEGSPEQARVNAVLRGDASAATPRLPQAAGAALQARDVVSGPPQLRTGPQAPRTGESQIRASLFEGLPRGSGLGPTAEAERKRSKVGEGPGLGVITPRAAGAVAGAGLGVALMVTAGPVGLVVGAVLLLLSALFGTGTLDPHLAPIARALKPEG